MILCTVLGKKMECDAAVAWENVHDELVVRLMKE